MSAGRVRTFRVIVADDDPLVRATVGDVLASEPDIELVATAADAAEAVEAARTWTPDVAIVDVKMPGGGPEASRGIIAASRATRVVAFSVYDDHASIREMIRSGASGYVVKGAPAGEIVEAVRRAAAGLGHLSASVAVDVVRELAGQLEREARAVELEQAVRERVERALEPGAITPAYQAIVDIGRSRIVGVEALARFPLDPSRPVDAWFADAAGIGRHVDLEVAAVHAEARAFEDAALGSCYVSLNVSPEAIVGRGVFDALAGLPRDRIVLEVTEHAPVTDYAALADALAPFRAAGGRLAVDDAGAGFASLRHILWLEPDIIKLDISLTRDIDTDRRRRALAAALITFASEMGIAIVAEGIETRPELDALRSLGVRFGQGYFLRRPCPLAQATAPLFDA
ncbi:MAG: EAL domain-containing protein [Chloroflexi bacterium]|jgi:EAL domain-containing protein (putative c-di-GMP-specific phosphodiesterase class I)/CheY-like chemotaxis protein|nr:EAL domain-containing protein [Chloroflexota bacterium]